VLLSSIAKSLFMFTRDSGSGESLVLDCC
jgi:hypothetical protein